MKLNVLMTLPDRIAPTARNALAVTAAPKIIWLGYSFLIFVTNPVFANIFFRSVQIVKSALAATAARKITLLK